MILCILFRKMHISQSKIHAGIHEKWLFKILRYEMNITVFLKPHKLCVVGTTTFTHNKGRAIYDSAFI